MSEKEQRIATLRESAEERMERESRSERGERGGAPPPLDHTAREREREPRQGMGSQRERIAALAEGIFRKLYIRANLPEITILKKGPLAAIVIND